MTLKPDDPDGFAAAFDVASTTGVSDMTRITENSITSMMQDVGEICTSTMHAFGNGELFFTEGNWSDWVRLHHELCAMHDRLESMVERSKEADPMPPEYRPLYDVTNGRGRIIA